MDEIRDIDKRNRPLLNSEASVRKAIFYFICSVKQGFVSYCTQRVLHSLILYTSFDARLSLVCL